MTILAERTQEFGNHYRKHLQIVKRCYEPLLEKIEINKKREFVHFLHPSSNFKQELEIVASVAENKEERLNFIGVYTALHLLWMNRNLIDTLKMELLFSERDRMEVYRDFMRQAGNQFRNLTAAYLEELIKIFLGEKNISEFVIMGVGTKSDQDDIDVGIIDEGSENRERFNSAIARISAEMLRYVTSFHFHLSEHIGTAHYSASIEEFKEVLEHELRDFVIINEMLGAAIIIGSKELFQKFQNEVISRYFYEQEGLNKYHEGYLRGILGEVRSLLAKPVSKSRISLKEDGLRPIKGIISAKKTVFNIWKVNAWDIIDELRKVDTQRLSEYNILEHSLTFIEIFRYLYQLFVTQEEEITIDEISRKNIRKIALLLGYVDVGPCLAEEHLLIHYYEHLLNLRRVIPIFLDDLKLHLKRNSTFTHLFELNYAGNLVCDFIEKFKFFRGTSFWDDILDDFRSEKILNRFMLDFNTLTPEKQRKMVTRYIGWLKYDLYTLMTFMVILGENKNSLLLYKKLNAQFLKIINRFPDTIRNIAFIFSRYPFLVNRLLALEETGNLTIYLNLLKGRVYEEDIAGIIEDLKGLINIYLISSHFFKRYFVRITNRYPECLRFLRDESALKEFAAGIYSDIGSMRTYEAKKVKLGDYYDFEMFRVGLATLNGASTQSTNTEFIEFSDHYIRTLYDLCREETDMEFNKRIITEDVLAIFASGGHAREQAFDDDYDLIVVLNSEDPELISYSNKVISKMNAEIIKRGTIPHHRFSEYSGRYVITLKELEKFLEGDSPDMFIEQSQVLGARLIAGSHRFEKDFIEKIIQPFIFEKKEVYIQRMLNELKSRHSVSSEFVDSGIDIKECAGGLRDIEMIMLIFKAKLEKTEPVNLQLFGIMGEKLPELKDDFVQLANDSIFLKSIRDVYRLTIGATDLILPEKLESVGSILGNMNRKELHKKFDTVRQGVIKKIHKLLNDL